MPFPLIAVLAPIVLTATLAYWATKCNEENEVKDKESSRLSTDNFTKCYDSYSLHRNKRRAKERCLEYAKSYSFVDNPNYDKCMDAYIKTDSYMLSYGVRQCMRITKSQQLVNNPDFDSCIEKYKNVRDGEMREGFDAVELCADLSNNNSISNSFFNKLARFFKHD